MGCLVQLGPLGTAATAWPIVPDSEHGKCAVLDICVAMLRCPAVNAATARFLFYMSQ